MMGLKRCQMELPHNFSSADSLITIDLDAIAANWQTLDAMSGPNTLTAGVVKANAYGLGVDQVAPKLAAAGCRLFFVMSLDEGIALRQILDANGDHGMPIFCLSGMHLGQEDEFLIHRLVPVINDLTQLARLGMRAQSQNMPLPAALHIDTGMNRLGLNADETDWLIEHIGDDANALEGIEIAYLMSHLSSAEAPDDAANATQLRSFSDLRPFFGGIKASLANSGGVMLGSDYHFDMVRPGIALYGCHPADDGKKRSLVTSELRPVATELRPVATWDARILQLRRANLGEAVGYGGTHILTRDSLIATIGVGYADGYRRALGGIAFGDIGGHSAPIIGRISMDSMALDVTDVPERVIQSAGGVRLIGDHYTVPMMAMDSGTISYEIMTSLGQRPHRNYIGNLHQAS